MQTAETDTFGTGVSSASELFGQTRSAMVLTGAGLAWMISGLSALGNVPLLLFLAVFAVAALLLLGGLAVRRSAPGLKEAPWTLQMRRIFRGAVAGETAGILLIVIVTSMLHQAQWNAPLIALAVGLHFFPLAHAFHRPLYYWTGGALCLICVMTISFVPQHFGAHRLPGWLPVASLGSGAALWLTSLWMLIQSATGLQKFFPGERLAK